MFIYTKKAKKKTKNHWDLTYKGEAIKSICKGEKYLVIDNGTLGKGRRSKNVGNKQAIAMLERLLNELKGEEIKVKTQLKLVSGHDVEFSPDDIPF